MNYHPYVHDVDVWERRTMSTTTESTNVEALLARIAQLETQHALDRECFAVQARIHEQRIQALESSILGNRCRSERQPAGEST